MNQQVCTVCHGVGHVAADCKMRRAGVEAREVGGGEGEEGGKRIYIYIKRGREVVIDR